LAAALLAVDPLHVYYSRTTYMEIPVSCFFLLFLWLVLRHLRTGRDLLIPAGISLGLTMATKSYYPFAIVLVVGMVIQHYRKQRESGPPPWTYLAATLLILPASIYLLSYLPWLGNGRPFFELFQMKLDAFKALQSFSYDSFVNIEWLKAGGKPWEWFLKPVIVCIWSASNGVTGSYLMEIHNPPIHLLTLPALLVCVWKARQQQQWNLLLIPAIFLSTYLVFVLVSRPIFSYSANVVLPFACLMIACAANILAERVRSGSRVLTVTMMAVILWGVYLFPLTASRTVPVRLYRPVLSHATYVSSPVGETPSPARRP
jgi:dolichyl-phosphate-mannose--protein O-mannosyl transferase